MSAFAPRQEDSLQARLTQLSARCVLAASACVACLDQAAASGLVDTFRHFAAAARVFVEISETTSSLSLRYESGPSHVLVALVRACERASAEVASAAAAHSGQQFLACAEACRNCQQACIDAVAVLRWR
jgi:hypothetical protein